MGFNSFVVESHCVLIAPEIIVRVVNDLSLFLSNEKLLLEVNLEHSFHSNESYATEQSSMEVVGHIFEEHSTNK